MLLSQRRDIIEAVKIRERLQIRLVLDQLFGAAVKQPDMRIDAGNYFTIELQHQTQHAVRRRMLRTKIDGEISECCWFGHRQTFGPAFSSPGSG